MPVIPRPARLVVQALTVIGLVAGTVAFASYDKSVDLVVDGQHRPVHAFGTTVHDVLSSQGITVGPHDLVTPAVGSAVDDDSSVVVRYGRRLAVTIDGRQREYWTTALTVDEALAQLGLHADTARLSVSRSQPLGRQGLGVDLDTRKDVTLVVGGKSAHRTTYAGTVGELLAEARVTASGADRLSVPEPTPLRSGATIRLDRVTRKASTSTRSTAFTIASSPSPELPKGRTSITTPGRTGSTRFSYLDTYVNGVRVSHQLTDTTVLRAPVGQVQQVGTKPAPTTEPDPAKTDPAKTDPAKTDSPTPGSDGLNWAALAKCESGGNPRAVNPAGYYGLYQFSLSTWHRVGGSGNPIDASPGEQTARAQELYKRGGAGQWGCGRHLFD